MFPWSRGHIPLQGVLCSQWQEVNTILSTALLVGTCRFDHFFDRIVSTSISFVIEFLLAFIPIHLLGELLQTPPAFTSFPTPPLFGACAARLPPYAFVSCFDSNFASFTMLTFAFAFASYTFASDAFTSDRGAAWTFGTGQIKLPRPLLLAPK